MFRFNGMLRSVLLLVASTSVVTAWGQNTSSVLDLTFEQAGTAQLFTAENGQVNQVNGALEYTFKKGSSLTSPSFAGSLNQIYNPTLENRNTLFFIMENRSSARQLRLSFITDSDGTYDVAKSKLFDIAPHTSKQAYYFNLSDHPQAKGRLMGLRIEPMGGKGTWVIDRITFEQEAVLEPFAGDVTACTATDREIEVKGFVDSKYLDRYTKIAVYETSMQLKTDDPTQMVKVYEGALTPKIEITGIPLYNGTMTRLSSQFLAVIEDAEGNFLKIAPRFYVDNWCDFAENPYAFMLPQRGVRVMDYGARGDGFTDDTDAIQAAIDDLSAQGGGRVTLDGDDSFYGRRYVATNILMKSNIELHIARGAILWQSQDARDYKYRPAYGHEGVIPGINWTHNMHVANVPLIQGKSIAHIKITGPGKIRSMDVESQDPKFGEGDYQRYCNDRIHVVSIGMWDVKHIEISNLDIVRANNYHTAFYGCDSLFIGNLKMHEVQCVSGDGIGLGGTHGVKIVRSFLESNDDGVVLWAGYNDPRGILWWWARPEADNSTRQVEVCHSYISSACKGAGKAIAFIPWGTDNPDRGRSEIDGITVFDCVLNGGYAVGTWPDNPYFGKQPFDNTEEDDYSPVKNVRIYNNKYLSACDLLCVRPTNFISDCGIHSSETFQNGTFEHGQAFWTMQQQAGVRAGVGYVQGGRLYEGLYLRAGTHTFTAEVQGEGSLFAKKAQPDSLSMTVDFNTEEWTVKTITIQVDVDDTYYLGISGCNARIRKAQLE